MTESKAKTLFDEQHRPVAVLIDFEEWQQIQLQLSLLHENETSPPDLNRHAGSISIKFDPLQYQQDSRADRE